MGGDEETADLVGGIATMTSGRANRWDATLSRPIGDRPLRDLEEKCHLASTQKTAFEGAGDVALPEKLDYQSFPLVVFGRCHAVLPAGRIDGPADLSDSAPLAVGTSVTDCAGSQQWVLRLNPQNDAIGLVPSDNGQAGEIHHAERGREGAGGGRRAAALDGHEVTADRPDHLGDRAGCDPECQSSPCR